MRGRGGGVRIGQCSPRRPPHPHRQAHSLFWVWPSGQDRQQPSSLSQAWSWAHKGRGGVSAESVHAEEGNRDAGPGSAWSKTAAPLLALRAAPVHSGQGWAGLSGLTAGQVSEGHVFFTVTTVSPSRYFSHLWVSQRFPASDQDSPGWRGRGQQVSPSPRAGVGATSTCLPLLCGSRRGPPSPLACLCQEHALQ